MRPLTHGRSESTLGSGARAPTTAPGPPSQPATRHEEARPPARTGRGGRRRAPGREGVRPRGSGAKDAGVGPGTLPSRGRGGDAREPILRGLGVGALAPRVAPPAGPPRAPSASGVRAWRVGSASAWAAEGPLRVGGAERGRRRAPRDSQGVSRHIPPAPGKPRGQAGRQAAREGRTPAGGPPEAWGVGDAGAGRPRPARAEGPWRGPVDRSRPLPSTGTPGGQPPLSTIGGPPEAWEPKRSSRKSRTNPRLEGSSRVLWWNRETSA